MQAHKISRCLALVLLSLSQVRGQIIQPLRYPGGPMHPQPHRQQRSLFGPPGPPIGWSSGGAWAGPSPSFGFSPLPPSSSPHVTKDELLALLAAWKDVEPKPTPSPPPEPEDEPVPEVTTTHPPEEEEEEEEPEPEAPAPAPAQEAPAGPPPGVPVTVSLPALVPIQLAAMWQTPVPGAGSVGLGLGGLGGLSGLGLGGGLAAAGNGPAAATARTATVARSRSRARARVGGRPANAASIRFPVANPRSFASGNYVAPRPRYYRAAPSQLEPTRVDVMPPPGYLAYGPGQAQLVPGYWQ
ncbi:proline-rich receptor-like protein kinase PERK13 [Drosophila obscura]|uniref:proline-rich receptor-like protein kinase PERK13 n=1 Tax=Drosophila obscura TaxID=7282 RepID=UPI000B9FF6AA|nr:proline-rich receptor-like protein kinase PERK13 [Drosophila obscura]